MYINAHTQIPTSKIEGLDVLLLGEETPAEERRAKFRDGLISILEKDLDRWVELDSTRRGQMQRLARQGWTNDADRDRDWLEVMAIWFWREIKENQPAREVYNAQMLAEIRNREALCSGLTLEDFDRRHDEVVEKLGGLQDSVDSLHEKVEALPDQLAETLRRRNLARPGRIEVLRAMQGGYVDRPGHVKWVEERLKAGAEMVLLTGGPGTGKSTLALKVGWRAWEQGRSAVYQFCGGLDRSAEEIGLELAAALPNHGAEAPPERQIESARRLLREAEALVILDDASDEAAGKLAPGGKAQVVLTSRSRQVGGLARDDVRTWSEPLA